MDFCIVGCIAIGCDERTDPPTLRLVRYSVRDEDREARRIRTAAKVPVPAPSRQPTPARTVALKGKQLAPVFAELTAAYAAALRAWRLGNHRRRALDAFSNWLTRTSRAGVTLDGLPARLRLYEKRTEKSRRWFGEQSFATAIEMQAYLTSDVEDFGKPFDEEERWLRVWIYLCGLRQVGRPKALEIAGKKPDSYARNLERRGGVAAREEAGLRALISEERERLDDLIRGNEYNTGAYAAPSQEEAEARLVRIGGVRFLVTDVRLWREKLPARGSAAPLWRELVDLRERRIMIVLENIERSLAPRPWTELATYPQ